MKFVFLFGGLCGFTLGLVASWLLDHAPDRILFDASVCCLAGAFLFRWFWTIVLAGLRDTVVARYQATLAQAATPAPAPAPKAK